MNKKCVTLNSSAFCITNVSLTSFNCIVAVENNTSIVFLAIFRLKWLTNICTV